MMSCKLLRFWVVYIGLLCWMTSLLCWFHILTAGLLLYYCGFIVAEPFELQTTIIGSNISCMRMYNDPDQCVSIRLSNGWNSSSHCRCLFLLVVDSSGLTRRPAWLTYLTHSHTAAGIVWYNDCQLSVPNTNFKRIWWRNNPRTYFFKK